MHGNGMKVWVTGAQGMLGGHFVDLLTNRGLDFVATGSRDLDITKTGDVAGFISAQKPTHIINCAAYTDVDKAETEKERAYLINAVGPQILGKAARRPGIKVIHFSTDYVFDGEGTTPYLEDDPCSPLSVYGSSKREGEERLLEESPQALIIRTSWLCGFPGKNFIETMLRLMSTKEAIRVVDDKRGRPSFCRDLAEAALPSADRSGIYHFANSNETSWYEFAREIRVAALEAGISLKIERIDPIQSTDYPLPARRPTYSVLSTSKIESLTKQVPRSWQAALREYLLRRRTQTSG